MIRGRAFYVFWHIAAWILLLTLIPKPAFNQGDAMIIPGVGVGVLKLGERVDKILEKIDSKYAKQWRGAKESGDKKIMWLSLEELGMSLAFDFHTRTLRKILVLTEALLVQSTGIRVGSSEKKVMKYLGDAGMHHQTEVPPEHTEERSGRPEEDRKLLIHSMDYPRLGIKFYINQEDHTVYTIEVYERPALN